MGGGSVPDNRSTQSTVATLVILLSWLALPNSSEGGPAPSKPKIAVAPRTTLSQRPTAEMLRGLPLIFEPNLGQTDPQVRFLTRASGMISFLKDRENVMVLSRRKNKPDPRDPHKTPEIEQTVVRMKLEGTRGIQRHRRGLLRRWPQPGVRLCSGAGSGPEADPAGLRRGGIGEHRCA